MRLLTMHSSKGLEFNSVAIPGLGCMPYAKVPSPLRKRHACFTSRSRARLNGCL